MRAGHVLRALALAGLVAACGDATGTGELDARIPEPSDGGAVPRDAPRVVRDAAAPPRDAGGAVDGGVPDEDAGGPTACTGLELGRCRTATGTVCVGDIDEDAVFFPMAGGDPISMVTGPQGASMFVMAARAEGIFPGNPAMPYGSDNPLVEIIVTNAMDEEIGFFRSRAAFEAAAGMPGTFEHAQLFVVVDAVGSRLAGQTLMARAELTDRDGVMRCGGLTFLAQ